MDYNTLGLKVGTSLRELEKRGIRVPSGLLTLCLEVPRPFTKFFFLPQILATKVDFAAECARLLRQVGTTFFYY